MAPIASDSESSSAPLADFFFISGIESTQVYDERAQSNGVAMPNNLDITIEEDAPLDTSPERPPSAADTLNGERRKSVRMSWDARKSIGSMINLEQTATASNRSSATIRAVQVGGTGLSEADFDKALRKFASERESFLDEISIQSGAVTPTKTPKPRPRAQRIVSDDRDVNNLRSSVAGSLRRRLSGMSSMKRASSVNRQSSVRTAKRMSNYNSVIPTPQPFKTEPNMHPLKRRYEPVLLDRYPSTDMIDEGKRRNPFPDYVPMFAFPDDINVVSSDERPRSTWHGFAMTSADNTKLYGICLTIWLPLKREAAEGIERQCEQWRRANMSGEERELASSLGERLAAERAKLSQLLCQLPLVPSGSDERENLEDDISAVEEKISLMTDLLRPVRHGAASKIEGLTDGETGLWIPRAFGVLGREAGMTSFWKEWLRAVVVPMTQGAVLRVPPSSPKIGMWQPLERYVVNLCAEALSPISSLTQVELGVRELRLYARKEANNELPGSRNTDLFALFRSLSIANIVTLFEYALSESRIIFLSSHTAMLHLATAALVNLLYPLKWASILIPVLPARLIQALDAPCPYIVGIERRYENVELPEDDFVLVDLDVDLIESTIPPTPLPRQQRRKLMSILQLAASHHIRYGVPTGPPAYAQEAFPYDSFTSENTAVFTANAPNSTLSTYAGLSSSAFGSNMPAAGPKTIIFNAFLQSRRENSRGSDRPTTSCTTKTNASPPSPRSSPTSTMFPPPIPTTPVSRSDSAYSLQANLREKRSGHFDAMSRRSSSFNMDRVPTLRRPSQPSHLGHNPSLSTSSLSSEFRAPSQYAPSIYAASTLAASTIMPNMLMQPVRNTDTTQWVEGHCLQWRPKDDKSNCSICDEKSDDGLYRCSACGMVAHSRCAPQVSLVCPVAFHEDQVRAAFVRCFASLFYTYRKFMSPASSAQKKSGLMYSFNMNGFLRSMPHENSQYMSMLQQTQAFNEFIHERESMRSDNPSVRLFDEVILSKRNRGKASFFGRSNIDFLSDKSNHLWRSAAASPPNGRVPGDYREVISRIPDQLDKRFMKEPRVIQGVPRVAQVKAKRKPIPSMLGIAGTSSPI
ncbi:DENN-domain-containing protein [Pseudovirgaria hyperparasitica]|uniref:DENN-domain-containing protein n=1 Tax=Pseudovirgaria hyperparasitica TaxID=470096 RepID=A0A6A6W9B4_9PEZI|nr:DENN-domain-containing protein [Pseudovirgaria hyperparasitica]KAF2759442.1 DENN-domain-containing protein [Pseudovirgaria hyperparasitica]